VRGSKLAIVNRSSGAGELSVKKLLAGTAPRSDGNKTHRRLTRTQLWFRDRPDAAVILGQRRIQH